MLRNLIVVLFVLSITYASSVPTASEQNNIGNGPSRDYQVMKTGSDKQQYGVEVEANRQFHHTSTEDDGVRLGCYGHVQDGHKYATRYVADARGYRVVPYADFTTVYPKSGEESRNASFSRDLHPDHAKFAHFYFPEECQKHHTEVASESRRAATIAAPSPKVKSTTDASFAPEDDSSSVTPASQGSEDEPMSQCDQRGAPNCECLCLY